MLQQWAGLATRPFVFLPPQKHPKEVKINELPTHVKNNSYPA